MLLLRGTVKRYGYHQEAASYINLHKNELLDFTITTDTAPFVLRKKLLLNCSDESTKTETPEIYINVPELFIEE